MPMDALSEAVSMNDVQLLSELLKTHSPDEVDSRGLTACHVAAIRGNAEALLVLLNAGADLTIADPCGNQPLHCCGHRDVVQVMANHGACLNAKNRKGDTALDLMIRRGVDVEVLDLMQELLHDFDKDFSASQPLISHPTPSQSVLTEFCADLGPKRLLFVVTAVFLLSLYVAYVVTGIAQHYHSSIPVTREELR